MKGILYVLSGPSGTGKGTVCAELLKRSVDLTISVSATTRDRRKGETEGESYFYVTKDAFEEMIEKGEMLEYAMYNGNYYGTPKKAVEDLINDGKDVLLEIEPQGALQVKKLFPEAVLIFLVPPSMRELRKRLTERGRETKEEIEERLSNAQWELKQADKYTAIIINNNLDECTNEVLEFMQLKKMEKVVIDKLINEKV